MIVAARFLVLPPEGYVPPAAPAGASVASGLTAVNWSAAEMLRTWQFYGLVFLFIGSAQSGLLVIANAAPMLNATAGTIAFFAANAWILSSFGGLVNATGRIGTGHYSDRIGRANAYLVNGVISASCLFLMPTIMASGNVPLLFLAVGVAYWQYGGGLALMPAFTADFFGPKNLGFNYGLVFIGWGIAFFVPQAAGYLKDATGSLTAPFYLSGTLLAVSRDPQPFPETPDGPGRMSRTVDQSKSPFSGRFAVDSRGRVRCLVQELGDAVEQIVAAHVDDVGVFRTGNGKRAGR